MPQYTIKLNVVMLGTDTIVLDHPDQFKVGQAITIRPSAPMEVRNQNGGSVRLTPDVLISGTVTAKH